MDVNLIIPIAIVTLAVSGFIFLATTMWTAWEAPENKRNTTQGDFFINFGGKHPLPHSDCYDKCMDEFKWDPARVSTCATACGL